MLLFIISFVFFCMFVFIFPPYFECLRMNKFHPKDKIRLFRNRKKLGGFILSLNYNPNTKNNLAIVNNNNYTPVKDYQLTLV